MSSLKDAGHLFRFAGLFVIAFLVFLIVRGYVVPKTFGQYGHYRGAAIGEIAAHPMKFAGHQACESCHTDIADTKIKRHACPCELRGLPRRIGGARQRSNVGDAREAGYGSALRTLPHGKRGQTEGISRRLIQQSTRVGCPARPATTHTARPSVRDTAASAVKGAAK